jgi:hypothetical protein
MKVEVMRESTDEEAHRISLDLQRSERQIRRLQAESELFASLHISHHYSPERINECLGLSPDAVSKPDDKPIEFGRFRAQYDNTFWRLSSKGKVRAHNIEAHLDWVLNQVSGRLPGLRHLQDTGGITKVFVYSQSWARIESLDLSPETLMLLARYRLTLGLTVHYQNMGESY